MSRQSEQEGPFSDHLFQHPEDNPGAVVEPHMGFVVNTRDNSVLFPRIPAFEDIAFTLGDCYTYGELTGIPPFVIAGVVTGRFLPHRLVLDTLVEEWNYDGIGVTTDEIIDQYDPLNSVIWYRSGEADRVPDPSGVPGIPRKRDAILLGRKVPVYEGYPISGVEPGDMLLSDEDKWIVVTKVIKPKHDRVTIFSNSAIVVASHTKNIKVIVAKHVTTDKSPDQMFSESSEKIEEKPLYSGKGISKELLNDFLDRHDMTSPELDDFIDKAVYDRAMNLRYQQVKGRKLDYYRGEGRKKYWENVMRQRKEKADRMKVSNTDS